MGIRQGIVNGLFREGGGELNPDAKPSYRTGIGFIDKSRRWTANWLASEVEMAQLEGRHHKLVAGASNTGMIDTRGLEDKERLVIDVPPQAGVITRMTPGVRYEFARSEKQKFIDLRAKNGGNITLVHPGEGGGKPVTYGEVYDLTVTAYTNEIGPDGKPLENKAIDRQPVVLSSVHPKSGLAIGDTVARNMTPQFTPIDINEFGNVVMDKSRMVGDSAGMPTTFAHDGSMIRLVNPSMIAGRPDVSQEIPLGLRVVEPVGIGNLLQPHMTIGDPTKSWLYEAAQQNGANGRPQGIQIIDPTIPR